MCGECWGSLYLFIVITSLFLAATANSDPLPKHLNSIQVQHTDIQCCSSTANSF